MSPAAEPIATAIGSVEIRPMVLGDLDEKSLR
jgi:hypothetical protein